MNIEMGCECDEMRWDGHEGEKKNHRLYALRLCSARLRWRKDEDELTINSCVVYDYILKKADFYVRSKGGRI